MSSHSVLFMQHFSKMDTQGESCPKGRCDHAAVCLGYGGDHPQLFVTGGLNGSVLSDVWLLDVQSAWEVEGGEGLSVQVYSELYPTY